MTKYVIHENNSGGWFCNPKGAMYIVIEANTEKEALDILEGQSWYTDSYCDCCGERWSGTAEEWNETEEEGLKEYPDDYYFLEQEHD